MSRLFGLHSLAFAKTLHHFDDSLQVHLQQRFFKTALPIFAFLFVSKLVALIQFRMTVVASPRDKAIVSFQAAAFAVNQLV